MINIEKLHVRFLTYRLLGVYGIKIPDLKFRSPRDAERFSHLSISLKTYMLCGWNHD